MEAQVLTREESLVMALEGVRLLMEEDYTPLQIRMGIEAVKKCLESFPQNEAFLSHYRDELLTEHFANGLYAREAILEKGTIGVTRVHEEQNISVMAKGKLAIITENGPQILEGPKVFTTPSGTQRLIFVLEDTVFVTVHPNPENTRDSEVLQARITASGFDEIAARFDSLSTTCGGIQ